MATLPIVRSKLAKFLVLNQISDIRLLRHERIMYCRGFRIVCKTKDGENHSSSDEAPESLFVKELKRRGINPASYLEEHNRSMYGRYGVLTDCMESLTNQREQFMARISEDQEVLISRARFLAYIGGAVLSECGPKILITVAFFSALYLYFEPAIIHKACRTLTSPPHVDRLPYALPEDEMIFQIAYSLN